MLWGFYFQLDDDEVFVVEIDSAETPASKVRLSHQYKCTSIANSIFNHLKKEQFSTWLFLNSGGY